LGEEESEFAVKWRRETVPHLHAKEIGINRDNVQEVQASKQETGELDGEQSGNPKGET
jgi:hypothetical protein